MGETLKRAGFVFTKVLPLILRTGRRPVLCVRQGALGDIICTFPAIVELKKRHPGTGLIYSCLPDFACLPRMAGVSDLVTSIYFDPKSRWRFLFSIIYNFTYNTESKRAASGSFIAEFCRKYGVTAAEKYVPLGVDPEVLSKVRERLHKSGIAQGPLVLLHPGPSWPIKEWPVEFWSGLVRELRKHGVTNLVQLGATKHAHLGELQRITIPDVVSLVDQLTVEETVALVSLGSLLIGIDSGMMHVAASVQVPAVGILGPTLPQFLYPRTTHAAFVVSDVECHGCHHREPPLHWQTNCPHEIRCMRAISVESVLQVCLAQLKERRQSVPT